MHRIYEWIRVILQEKVNVFIKGASSGGLLSGVLLFGSSIHDKNSLLFTYTIKLFAVLVCGVISGFASVLGNDAYKWVKATIIKKKTKIKRKNNETRTKVKRAS